MLYHLRPHADVTWNKYPADTLDLVSTQKADLSGLDWSQLDMHIDRDGLLALALRFGVATSTGLVVTDNEAAYLRRPAELRATQDAMNTAHAAAEVEKGSALEALVPGRGEAVRQQADRITATSEGFVARAERELSERLSAPVNQALAAHWEQLGGVLPA